MVNAVDVPSIYDIPSMLHDQGLDEYLVRALGLEKERTRAVSDERDRRDLDLRGPLLFPRSRER